MEMMQGKYYYILQILCTTLKDIKIYLYLTSKNNLTLIDIVAS